MNYQNTQSQFISAASMDALVLHAFTHKPQARVQGSADAKAQAFCREIVFSFE